MSKTGYPNCVVTILLEWRIPPIMEHVLNRASTISKCLPLRKKEFLYSCIATDGLFIHCSYQIYLMLAKKKKEYFKHSSFCSVVPQQLQLSIQTKRQEVRFQIATVVCSQDDEY